jgi:CubicO group peptidase (beta-lactamase class C family)
VTLCAADLRESLEDWLRRHDVPGASVALFHRGEKVAASAGVANVVTGVEVTPDTVMHIGSITKIFNATLVMQLVDDGSIDLGEPVARYLPDLLLKDRSVLEQITVQMLLNHTSGIDAAMLPDHGHDEETIEKGIARFAQLGQLFPPGSEFSYCNGATVIAGYLVQRLAGKSWYTLVRERIFEPLGMRHAAALPEEALLHRASVGHYRATAPGRPVRTSFAFMPLSFAPCGTTLMTSAADLISFARAHMADGSGANGIRLLSAESTRAMQRITVDHRNNRHGYGDGMGLGWMVFKNGLLHHAGGGPGIVAALYAHPQRQFAVAILTNAENGMELINEWLQPWLGQLEDRALFGQAHVDIPTQHVEVDPDRYVGIYEDVTHRYRVSPGPRGLSISGQAKFSYLENVTTAETPPTPLLPIGGDDFLICSEEIGRASSTSAARVFTFRNPDATGRMSHLGNFLRLYPRVS